MSLDYDSIRDMSNQALFSMIENKKQNIESLKAKGGDSKAHELDYCYLVRERQKRFHRKNAHPDCCVN